MKQANVLLQASFARKRRNARTEADGTGPSVNAFVFNGALNSNRVKRALGTLMSVNASQKKSLKRRKKKNVNIELSTE